MIVPECFLFETLCLDNRTNSTRKRLFLRKPFAAVVLRTIRQYGRMSQCSFFTLCSTETTPQKQKKPKQNMITTLGSYKIQHTTPPLPKMVMWTQICAHNPAHLVYLLLSQVMKSENPNTGSRAQY